MNQDKDQDRDCPTCIEKIGVWTEPDGPCPGWEPKDGEDGRPRAAKDRPVGARQTPAATRTGGCASLGADAAGAILGAMRGNAEIM